MMQEEPKQETPEQHLELINNNIEEFDKAIKLFRQRKSKQETLEEAAEKFLKENNVTCLDILENVTTLDGVPFNQKERIINAFVKWQQEQNKNLYSEEDLKQAFFSGCYSERKIKPREKCWEEFIEQFKKK